MKIRTSIFRVIIASAVLLSLGACMAAKEKPKQIALPTDAELIGQLAGTVWVAEYIHGNPVVDASHTSMVFTTEGKVSGRGGCNNFTGSYILKDGKISFPPMAVTMKMCAPALSKQEYNFFQSLDKPQKVSFQNGMLSLTPNKGDPSVFGPYNTEQ